MAGTGDEKRGGVTTNGLTYADAGVSIDSGDALIERIKPAAAATRRPGVLGALGGFAGLFDLQAAGLHDPLLVSATDGVGTKLKLAIDDGGLDALDGLGIDLVAMCVNDLLCQGAEPLFFLDYFATGKLDPDRAARVVESIAAGCLQAGAALLGGETAEMPGLYADGDFDLAGFSVGAVERARLLPRSVEAGDRIIALASDGVHSNGYSLVRKIIELQNAELTGPAAFDPDQTLGAALLTPTRIYAKAIKAVLSDEALEPSIAALAHITGGGLIENPPRVLAASPDAADLAIAIDLDRLRDNLPPPPVFGWLARAGGVAEREMLRTFNCGVGLCLFVRPAAASTIVSRLERAGERVADIGAVEAQSGAKGAVRFSGSLFGA